jgi:hypothetical protein
VDRRGPGQRDLMRPTDPGDYCPPVGRLSFIREEQAASPRCCGVRDGR